MIQFFVFRSTEGKWWEKIAPLSESWNRKLQWIGLKVVKVSKPMLGGGNSNSFYVHPENWGNDPIWLISNIFRLGWFNHQLEWLCVCKSWGMRECFFQLLDSEVFDSTGWASTKVLPETNSKFAPEKRPPEKRKMVFQPSICRGDIC